jgi:hypothetical protein
MVAPCVGRFVSVPAGVVAVGDGEGDGDGDGDGDGAGHRRWQAADAAAGA